MASHSCPTTPVPHPPPPPFTHTAYPQPSGVYANHAKLRGAFPRHDVLRHDKGICLVSVQPSPWAAFGPQVRRVLVALHIHVGYVPRLQHVQFLT